MNRLFVAIDLPDEVREQLASLERGIPGARWIPPENLHLTLRFIGEVANDVMEDVAHALSNVEEPAFELSLAGVGHFEKRARPTTLWADVEPNPALNRLQGRIESALQRVGLEPEGRRFRPHITLARLGGSDGGRVSAFLAAHGLYRSAPFPVEAFALYSSFLRPEGSLYREEAVYPLLGCGYADHDDDDESW